MLAPTAGRLAPIRSVAFSRATRLPSVRCPAWQGLAAQGPPRDINLPCTCDDDRAPASVPVSPPLRTAHVALYARPVQSVSVAKRDGEVGRATRRKIARADAGSRGVARPHRLAAPPRPSVVSAPNALSTRALPESGTLPKWISGEQTPTASQSVFPSNRTTCSHRERHRNRRAASMQLLTSSTAPDWLAPRVGHLMRRNLHSESVPSFVRLRPSGWRVRRSPRWTHDDRADAPQMKPCCRGRRTRSITVRP